MLWIVVFILLGLPNVAQPFSITPNAQSFLQAKNAIKRNSACKSRLDSTSLKASAVSPGDTVLVIGGTGGVGQLVVNKLQSRNFSVRTTSRDKERGIETIGNDAIDVFEVDLLSEDTRALEEAMDGANGIVISVGTTAFPTGKWQGGNTPKAIDEEAVKRIAQVATKLKTANKICIVTSVGVERTGEMPFLVLNLFGVLDAKRSGEQAVAAAAKTIGADFVVVRPGRLVGGPFTNLDIAGLLKLEGGTENGVSLEEGDSLLGDCKRDACAEALVQSLINENCKNVAFSIVSNEEKALTEKQWTAAFQGLLK